MRAAAVAALVLGLAAALSAQAFGAQFIQFKSPSGNINCGGGPTGVTCLLVHNSWKTLRPRPASCDLDWSPTDMSLFLDSRTKRWRVAVGGCRGDVGPRCYAQVRCAVLRYGTSITTARAGRGIRCTSRPTGITCKRFGAGAGVRGFRIAREGYTVLR